jgi:hypothetical protein
VFEACVVTIAQGRAIAGHRGRVLVVVHQR